VVSATPVFRAKTLVAGSNSGGVAGMLAGGIVGKDIALTPAGRVVLGAIGILIEAV
jgi:hypothetical protein